LIRDFIDTSVFVGAFWGDHVDHESSLEIFAQARKSVTACSAHSLAEVYAVMTALPVRPQISPDQVLLFVEQIRDKTTIVALNEGEYVSAMRAASESAVVGGRIYDFLLLAAARKIDPKNIYTWNAKHFRDLAPDWEKRVRTPKQA
jgi:predicted nucleic acid-binding protein